VDEWIKDGLPRRSQKTKDKYTQVLSAIHEELGDVPLRDLTVRDIRAALSKYAQKHATDTVAMARLSLERAINFAMAEHKVGRNVAALVESPVGQEGRPSKALSFDQAVAVIQAAEQSRLHGYVVVCTMTGVH